MFNLILLAMLTALLLTSLALLIFAGVRAIARDYRDYHSK